MPSPFPGMDPYIEQSKLWPDFHNRLADEISARLNRQIRPDYFARLIPHTIYEVEVWPLALHERLPVPLNPPDEDAALVLNDVLAAVYERGGYDLQIDYGKPPPPPPLSPKERKWVVELLRPLRGR